MSDRRSGDVAIRGSGEWLFLCALLINAYCFLAPTPGPLKTYNTIGGLHYAVFLMAPMCAWFVASHRTPLWMFIVFGSACAVVFDLRLGHRWASFVFVARREIPFALDLSMLSAISVGLGLLCRWTAIGRQRFERRRTARVGRCLVCSYDLTGNVSGTCPECGTAIPRDASIPGINNPPPVNHQQDSVRPP